MQALLAYDAVRVRALSERTGAAIRWLEARNSSDPLAGAALAPLLMLSHSISTAWMPWFTSLLGDTSLTDWHGSGPAAAASAVRGFAGAPQTLSADEIGRLADEMVTLAAEITDGDRDSLIELRELLDAYSDNPAVVSEFQRRLGPERFDAFVALLASGECFLLGGLAAAEDVAARDGVLAVLLPTPLRLETNPDFDLSEAVSAGGDWLHSDSAWWAAINPECANLPGGDYTGGGFVTGPDGRQFPIVIPNVPADGGVYTADTGIPARGEPCIANLNGGDDGWAPIGYQSGVERFQEGPSWAERTLGFFAGTTGLVVAPPPSDGLQFIQMRPGALPYLAAAPAGSPSPAGSAEPELTVTGQRSPTPQAALDLIVRGTDGWVFAASMDYQRERAYQVVYEEHADGRIRARIATFTLAEDRDGDIVIIPEDVWVNHEGHLMSQLTTYAPPEDSTGVWSNVSDVAFEPGTRPTAYEVTGQSFP